MPYKHKTAIYDILSTKSEKWEKINEIKKLFHLSHEKAEEVWRHAHVVIKYPMVKLSKNKFLVQNKKYSC